MNTETYLKLKWSTGKCADDHYACMQEWLKKKKDPAVARQCRASALKYRKALEDEMAYLRSRPQTPQIAKRIDQTAEFLRLILRDISFLSGH